MFRFTFVAFVAFFLTRSVGFGGSKPRSAEHHPGDVCWARAWDQIITGSDPPCLPVVGRFKGRQPAVVETNGESSILQSSGI